MQTVLDTNGSAYKLSRRIGSGGQGTVFEVQGGKLAVKFLKSTSGLQRELLQNQLAFLRRLPLHDIPIAQPLATLRAPYTGYVMRLVTGMVPLQSLIMLPRDCASPTSWYTASGGLRRRLKLLSGFAVALGRLHALGLVYCDPSPNNFLISEPRAGLELRLIDADNLTYASGTIRRAPFTPGFGAPELAEGRASANSLTDAHAFAVIAFQTLSMVHPFIGDAVHDGPPEVEELAFAGKLPWIDDPTDDSNRTSFGIRRDFVLSPSLSKLCVQTFGPGRNERSKRPGVAEWAERLTWASANTLKCEKCAATFYADQEHCPWCGQSRGSFLRGFISVFDPGAKNLTAQIRRELNQNGLETTPLKAPPLKPVGGFAVSESETLELSGFHLHGDPLGFDDTAKLKVVVSKSRLTLSSASKSPYLLVQGATKYPVAEKAIPISLADLSKWALHLGPADRLHRVIQFRHQSSEK
jgi:DNA-binding helix-hairpin-helix protein with protein kinase domain